jgi:hypothetical protein
MNGAMPSFSGDLVRHHRHQMVHPEDLLMAKKGGKNKKKFKKIN